MTGDLVVGLGCRPGVAAVDVLATVAALLARHGLDPTAVRAYATLDERAAEPGLRALAAPASADSGRADPALTVPALLAYPARLLALVDVPNPSARVVAAVGTASVAEAAALHAAGELAPPGAEVALVAPKLAGAGVTAAAARISSPRSGPA
ncbi:MAG TPA: cobalamin biosynthesis protein [Pseudonocardia sp.]|nr:cobalamin biosynthesis protein [Pseudonocardia sp.]